MLFKFGFFLSLFLKGEGGGERRNTGLCHIVLSIPFCHNLIVSNINSLNILAYIFFFFQELSVDFCPEQISARSSSFKSSIKYDSSNSKTPNVSLQNKRSYNFPILPSPKEDLENEVLSGSENEVLSGSCLQIPETKFQSKNDNSQNNEGIGKFFFSLFI